MVVKESMCVMVRSIEPAERYETVQDFIPLRRSKFRRLTSQVPSASKSSLAASLRDCP
jgi:hypothetical protein